MEEEAAAADPRRLWLDDAQHHLHRDGGIDRRAAALQDIEPGLDRHRMGGSDHLLRFSLRCPSCGKDRQDKGGKPKPPPHARRATMNRRRNWNSVMPSARVGYAAAVSFA